MARIRTIKPEFPQSESMGKVSRDARLCFIEMWTLADDSGRLRGNSRMLASILFPYDNDAPALIEGWLQELDREGCIQRYTVDGASYVQIANWLSHQKIDKPSPSKLPAIADGSRILANPREGSSLDQGSRTKDQDQDHTPQPPAGEREAFEPDGFKAFWNSWPKNDRKEAKGKCLTAWRKGKLEAVASEVLAHVEAMAATDQWKREGGRFIPAPLVYLNGRRWEGAEVGQSESDHMAGAI